MSKIITLKDPGGYSEALLLVACNEGHGNKSQVIIDSLNANPLIIKALKKNKKNVAKK